jgi:hypothetical protein
VEAGEVRFDAVALTPGDVLRIAAPLSVAALPDISTL